MFISMMRKDIYELFNITCIFSFYTTRLMIILPKLGSNSNIDIIVLRERFWEVRKVTVF